MEWKLMWKKIMRISRQPFPVKIDRPKSTRECGIF
jgi:hypothetical protein